MLTFNYALRLERHLGLEINLSKQKEKLPVYILRTPLEKYVRGVFILARFLSFSLITTKNILYKRNNEYRQK